MNQLQTEIQKLLTYYRSSYDILLLEDFNMLFFNKNVKDLCDIFKLNHLIKGPACFKSSNPSCIDNFYTNKNTMFLIYLLSRQGFLTTIV